MTQIKSKFGFILIVLALFLAGCVAQKEIVNNDIEKEFDTENGKYAFYEIKADTPGYQDLIDGKINCNRYCINNAGVEVIIKDSRVYCKCMVPTSI
ncbi:hypothetical protein JXA12_03600 [Candidatus Woesearchaeota archaeon]|nr:hypothetical protein [Candidatus Woesearchaeota archaeon]